MEHKKYYIPPKMTRSAMVGGFRFSHICVLLAMAMVIIALLVGGVGINALYFSVIPLLYGVLVYSPRGDRYSGLDYFKKVIHFYWTPQHYSLAPRLREEENGEGERTKTKRKSTGQWLDFELCDDHVVTGSGAARREHYLMRLLPKNMEILGQQDRLQQEGLFQALLDGSDQIIPSFFIMDKTEGMRHIRKYQQGLMARYAAYDYIYEDIVKQLDGMEEESASVERAFYLCLTVRERAEMELFSSRLRDCMAFYLAERSEWIVVLRNFLLREYTPFPIAQFDETIQLAYLSALNQQSKKRRPKEVVFENIAKEELWQMLLPKRMVFNTRYCEQNDFLRKTIAVRNYPALFEHDCVLRQLGCMENTAMRIYLEPLTDYEVSKLINMQSDNSQSKARLGKQAQKIEAETEQKQIRKSYQDMLENNEKMFYVTILIEVYGANVEQLNKRVDKIKNMLLTTGITKDDLIYEQRETFLSMLPYGENHISLMRNMPSSTVAALYPFTSSKKVDEHGLLIGRTASRGPVIWDPYLRDDDITSGNFLVVGAPGQGKSYLVKKIVAQLIAQGVSCFVLDPENEYGKLFSKMHCSNIECGSGGYIINPLEVRIVAHREDIPDDDLTPEAFKCVGALKQHMSWLREFLQVLFPEITNRELNIISILIREHYESYGIGDAFDPRVAMPADYPTFGTLYEYIRNEYQQFDPQKHPEFGRDDLQNVLLQLREVYDGSCASIFNGVTNIPNADVINFQLQTLLQGSSSRMAAVMFNIMTWVMTKLVGNPKQRQAFFVDEVYTMLDRNNPVVMLYLRNYAKRNRKYEGILGMSTQNVVDFNDPEVMHITSALLQLPPHKFLFHLGDVEPAILRQLLGLEDNEISLISRSRKRHCLLKSGADRYYVEIGTLPYEQELFGDAGGR